MSKICRKARVEREIREARKAGQFFPEVPERKPIPEIILDSRADIQRCLTCEKKECQDCIQYLPEANKVKVKQPFGYDRFSERFLEEYIYAESDYKLMEALGAYKYRVKKYRKLYGLPLPSKLTRRERAELVARIRGAELL